MFDGGGRDGFGFFNAFAWLGHLVLGAVGVILWLFALAVVVAVVFLLVRYLLVATKAAQRYLDLNPAVPAAFAEPPSDPAPGDAAADAAAFDETVIDEIVVVEAPVAPPMAPPVEPPAPKSASAHVSAGSEIPASPKPRTPRTPRTPKTPPAAG